MAAGSTNTFYHCIQLYKYITVRINDSLVEILNSISHAVVQTTHLNGPILTLSEYLSKLQCVNVMAIDCQNFVSLHPII